MNNKQFRVAELFSAILGAKLRRTGGEYYFNL